MSNLAYHLTEGDIDSFFDVPFQVHGKINAYNNLLKSDLQRILDPGKNPLFRHFGSGTFFTLWKNGLPCGRIVAHVHSASNALHNTKRGLFGLFDCINDQEAARILLEAAENYSRSQGMDEIVGNFNLTAMQQIGVVTGGFNKQPFSDQAFNAPYISELLESCGYKSCFTMTTFEANIPKALAAINENNDRRQYAADLKLQKIKRRNLQASMETARLLLNDGFRDNPMFVPVSAEEFSFQAKDMMFVLDPRISFIATIGNEPAGVVVCIPDLNPLIWKIGGKLGASTPWHYLNFLRNRKRAVIVYYSVAQKYHGRGVMGRLLAQCLGALDDAGYEQLGVTWIADENKASLRQMERIGAVPLHRLSLFGKHLELIQND